MYSLSTRAPRPPSSGSNTNHVAPRRPISGTPRRGVQRCPSAGGGRLPAIIGRCGSVRLVAVSSGRDPQVRRASGRGGAVGQGVPGSPSDDRRAAPGAELWARPPPWMQASAPHRRRPIPCGSVLPPVHTYVCTILQACVYACRETREICIFVPTARFCLCSSAVPSPSLGLFKLPSTQASGELSL